MIDTELILQQIRASVAVLDQDLPLWIDDERIDVPPIVEGWLRVLLKRVEAWEDMALVHDLVGPEQVSETLLQRAETIVKLHVLDSDQPVTPMKAMGLWEYRSQPL